MAVANGATVFKDIEVKVWTRAEAEIAQVKPLLGPKTSETMLQPAVSGKREYALAFDGLQSYVETPVKYDGCHPLTIEAWVTWDGSHYGAIASDRKESHGLFHGLFLGVWERKWWFQKFTEGDQFVGAMCVDASAVYEPTHVAGVFDFREIRLYVGGLQAACVPCEKYTPSDRQFLLGAARGDELNSDPFPGVLYAVRFSKVARYTRDFKPEQRLSADADTIALYHFDEGSGNIAHDASKNGNHAKIHGARWVEASDVKNRLPGLVVGTPRLPDGRRWQLETISPYWPGGLDWSPDGKWISCARDSVIRIQPRQSRRSRGIPRVSGC